MEVVHICNNYVGTKVHLNQIASLANKQPNLVQNVIIPVYDPEHKKINNIEVRGVSLHYEVFNLGLLKYFPLIKLLYVSVFLLLKYNNLLKNADVVFAHTLWTNGFLAYLSNKLYKVNYIVAARSNDYHTFLKFLPHYRFIIRAITNNSNKVIFISNVYKRNFIQSYPRVFKGVSSTVIHNGIDKFWIEKAAQPLKAKDKKSEVLFVGRFNKTKNINLVLDTIVEVRKLFPEVSLRVVGGEKDELLSLLNYKKLPSWVQVEGKVNKEKLYSLYSQSLCLFVPSVQETFGLVYIEALASGCPVIHSVNEAIDGIYRCDSNVLAVNPHSLTEMTEAIIQCIHNSFDFDRSDIIDKFSWETFSLEITKVLYSFYPEN
ncbi:glycosyltransferase family 4 protein [uncultured Pseudoalteromonas sp.]|uniref:glycosyltransferase family 4 protein n=1 Tax=uncultured Pseudoalteromonas sp. TaxID=114053 RepID=UPI0030C88251